jgi:hypothetical protein
MVEMERVRERVIGGTRRERAKEQKNIFKGTSVTGRVDQSL